jgi:hypothetical protein
VITPRPTSGGKKGGWGIVFFIALMVLSRAPRLWKNFRADPPPPPPVQIDDDFLRQLEQDLDFAEAKDDDEEMPALPDGVELDDPNQDPDGR